MQSAQGIEGSRGELDLLAVKQAHGQACIQVLFVREGRVLGSRTYYPATQLEEDETSVLTPLFLNFTSPGAKPFRRKL